MTSERFLPEQLAMLVHHYSEALAPDFGLQPSARPEWTDLTVGERGRMVAATRLALMEIRSAPLPDMPAEMPRFAEFHGGSEGKECGA
jgi:hypothetical protein